jgi:SNF2 family DNA or RNA helicase
MEERERTLSDFQNLDGPRVLLVSLKAGGVGLNLQAANVIVLFDRWWNPAVELQAIFRAHRFDRSSPLHVIRFTIRETVEEHIAAILVAKAQLFDEYVDSASTTEVVALSRQDLLSVIGLEDDSQPAPPSAQS